MPLKWSMVFAIADKSADAPRSMPPIRRRVGLEQEDRRLRRPKPKLHTSADANQKQWAKPVNIVLWCLTERRCLCAVDCRCGSLLKQAPAGLAGREYRKQYLPVGNAVFDAKAFDRSGEVKFKSVTHFASVYLLAKRYFNDIPDTESGFWYSASNVLIGPPSERVMYFRALNKPGVEPQKDPDTETRSGQDKIRYVPKYHTNSHYLNPNNKLDEALVLARLREHRVRRIASGLWIRVP